MKGLRIALVHNLKPSRKDPSLPVDYYSECDSAKTVGTIRAALEKNGHTVLPVEADNGLPVWLSRNPVDLVFNIAEGFEGEAREARVPALLELMGIPCTGSGVLCLALALDKAKSKHLFRQGGIPTPNFQLFSDPADSLDARLKYPLIVKPNCEGSAKGILASSVVKDEPALRRQVQRVFEAYGQEVLVEEYIEGTEITVGILDGEVLPVLEIDFGGCGPSGEFFYSWRMKEFQGDEKLHLVPKFFCPARLSPEVTRAVQAVALRAARALGARAVVRVDIRLSSDGIPYVLEVNPLPGMDPEESNLPIMVRAAGIPYEAFIQRLIEMTLERTPSSVPSSTNSVPIEAVPQSRALPGSGEPAPGQPGSPAVLAGRTGPRQRVRARNNDPMKEGNVGR